jgi:hypothetical protein
MTRWVDATGYEVFPRDDDGWGYGFGFVHGGAVINNESQIGRLPKVPRNRMVMLEVP